MSRFSGNIYEAIPKAANEEIFEDLIHRKDARIERIVSTGQATPEDNWYDQDTDEFVMLLSGEAGLAFADTGRTHDLQPGDWHWIPAHYRHRVVWTSQDPPAVWLAIHLPPSEP